MERLILAVNNGAKGTLEIQRYTDGSIIYYSKQLVYYSFNSLEEMENMFGVTLSIVSQA